jgi:hypothetical protein
MNNIFVVAVGGRLVEGVEASVLAPSSGRDGRANVDLRRRTREPVRAVVGQVLGEPSQG